MQMKYAALYCRVSKEDEMVNGGSNSIENQRHLLECYAAELGYKQTKVFIDDGYSGTIFERPGLQAMLTEAEAGLVSAVIVKDLSRFGRNYLTVGYYIEEYFPKHNVRFIAINDNYDSINDSDDMMPMRNVFNEYYAKEASKKIRSSYSLRGKMGEPLGAPPYGYVKSPENPKRWVIDKAAANVVRRIFQLYSNGNGIAQIADILENEKILSPQNYWNFKGVSRGGRISLKSPYVWSVATISNILEQREYLGDVVNFKTYSQSFKDKRRLSNDEENIVIFEGIHEPIINMETWDKVQSERRKKHKIRKTTSNQTVFSGLLVCSSCGANLHFHFNQKNPDNKYFNCSRYNKSTKLCSASHNIRIDFLEQVVLQEFQRIIRYAVNHEEHFIENVENNHLQVKELIEESNSQENAAFIKRRKELDILFERLYDDRLKGILSEERFEKLITKFKSEQEELDKKLSLLTSGIALASKKKAMPKKFLLLASGYYDIQQLTRENVCDLIEKIEVYHVEILGDEKVQTIKIYFNHIGYCAIPDIGDLKQESVKICPRKGVLLKYLPFNVYEKTKRNG